MFLRRLLRILKIPTEKYLKEKEEAIKLYKPLIQSSINRKDTVLRDQLLNMLMFCNDFEVTQITLDIEDMDQLFKNYTPILGKAFDQNCFVHNKSCEEIKTV